MQAKPANTGGFDAEKVRELLHLPHDCTPMAMLAVGYQAEVDVLYADFKAIEQAERTQPSPQGRGLYDSFHNFPPNLFNLNVQIRYPVFINNGFITL
jgi:hypothetical protein